MPILTIDQAKQRVNDGRQVWWLTTVGYWADDDPRTERAVIETHPNAIAVTIFPKHAHDHTPFIGCQMPPLGCNIQAR